jgi:hypothetical protein
MKTYLIFSSREPMLVVTRESIQNTDTMARLNGLGLTKFIAREIPVEEVGPRYGYRFEVIGRSIHRGKSCRVLDYNGEQVMKFIAFSNLGPAIYSDPGSTPLKDASLDACIASGKRVQAHERKNGGEFGRVHS